ncbi:MAG: 50S ribosomal protein L11 methyltransferase [Thermoplasmata archaeon]|nr:50S ribosomal protein L11 methyltransferase [Thermoplasmata archaeon]
MSLSTDVYVLSLVGVGIVAYFLYASFAFGAGYQPTPARVVRRMLELAAIGPRDAVYDLGAGTGAIVFAAARTYGARVVGVEVEPLRVLILRLRLWWGGPRDRITIVWGSIFKVDLHSAQVVAVFLWPGAMARLKAMLENQLPAGARVVSHWHKVPGWTAEVVDPELRVYFYRWPAARVDAGGTTGESGTRAPRQ